MVESQLGIPLAAGVGVAVGVSAAGTYRAVGGVDAESAVSAVGKTLDEGPGRVGQAHDGILLVAMIISLRGLRSHARWDKLAGTGGRSHWGFTATRFKVGNHTNALR